MQEEIKLVITGFKTIEAAKEFANWYSGQGEQDIDIWWECRQDKLIGKSPICNSIDINNNIVTMEIKN